MNINFEIVVALLGLLSCSAIILLPLLIFKERKWKIISFAVGAVLLVLLIIIAHLPTYEVEIIEKGEATIYTVATYFEGPYEFCVVQDQGTFEFIGINNGHRAEKFEIPVEGTMVEFVGYEAASPRYVVRKNKVRIGRDFGPLTFTRIESVEERTLSVREDNILQSYELKY